MYRSGPPIREAYFLKCVESIFLISDEVDYKKFTYYTRQMNVGDYSYANYMTLEGLNSKGVAYYGFNKDNGCWIVTDKEGNELDAQSAPVTVEKDPVSKNWRYTAVKPGSCFLAYRINDGIYATADAPTDYITNDDLEKTAALEIIVKAANPLTIKGKTAKVKYKKLKKKAQSLAVTKVIKFQKKAGDKKNYKLVSAKKGKKSFKKYFKINKTTGKLTIKKNKKMKKGTYKVKIKVKALGNAAYKPSPVLCLRDSSDSRHRRHSIVAVGIGAEGGGGCGQGVVQKHVSIIDGQFRIALDFVACPTFPHHIRAGVIIGFSHFSECDHCLSPVKRLI